MRRKRGSSDMSEKEERILKTFGEVMPELPELEKEKLLSYGEGYAAGYRGRMQNQKLEEKKKLELQGV